MTIINPRPLYRERLRWISASAVALAFGPALRARAQSATYPTRPMRLVVPFPPGGSPDVQARMLAQKLSVRWGQPVVVENKAGASGNIGAEQVVKSPPDGHTLLMVVSNMLTSNPVLTRTPFDPLKDFTPVGVTAQVQFMLVCHPAVPAATAAEFIRHVRAQPGRLNYGSSGDGSTQHLATLLLSDLAGLSMTHIPYKGAAPAVTDLLSGQIQVWIGAANSLMPYVKDKRLRALAVTGRDRWSGAPELPTLAARLRIWRLARIGWARRHAGFRCRPVAQRCGRHPAGASHSRGPAGAGHRCQSEHRSTNDRAHPQRG